MGGPVTSGSVTVQPAGKAAATVPPPKYVLSLENNEAGVLHSVKGGEISAKVVTENVGTGRYATKHISQPIYEPYILEVGFGMTRAIYDWIASTWKMNYQRKDGSLIAVTPKEQAANLFFQALITETTIPALDASGKDPGFLTVKLAPEYTRTTKPTSTVAVVPPESKRKLFMPPNYKVEIDGLDCTGVTKVDAFTVKPSQITDNVGDGRDYAVEPGKLDFPDLRVEFTGVKRKTWDTWFEEFVLKGKNTSESNEKNGVITLLAPDLKEVLATIRLHNLGIFRLSELRDQSRVSASLYCEYMEFEGPKSSG